MTTPAQIATLAVAGESTTLEFKKSTAEKDRACRTLCAFANGQGGQVLFGVTPAGKVLGQAVSDRTLEELAQEFQGFEPPLFPAVERVPVDGGRDVLVLTVARGARVPVAFRGVAYERVLNTTRTMPRDSYQRLLVEEMHATERWENRPAAGWSVSDLDHEEIRRTLEAGIQAGRIEEPTTRDPLEVLRGLGLVKQDALLRAAVVLFGRADRLLPDFTQCLLRVARFRGTEKGEFLDNRQFHGNAFEIFQRAQRFLRDHMAIAGHFEPGRMERIDTPAYSPLAFREAIANAICHRDYSTGGSSIGIAMYDDRLEVSSSGALHFGFTPQSLFEPHESRPWNPLIASVFYRRGIIETWGQGTLKMAAWAKEAGLPAPEILEIPGAVVVRFRPSAAGMAETTRRTPGKTPGERGGNAGETLGKTPMEVLGLLREQPELSTPLLAERLGKSLSATERAIKKLREAGLLVRIGPDKGGHWQVIE